jgi:hypothetical protein
MKGAALFFLLGLWTLCAPADIVSSGVTSAARALAMSLDVYQENHGGALPKNWSDLEGEYIIRRGLEQELGGPLEEKFPWFADVTIPMAPPGSESVDGGRILSITSTPLREDRRRTDGRYVIWQRANGRVGFDWIAEPVAAKQFEQAGVPLPTGPVSIQPTFRSSSVEDIVREYAEKHFKNPSRPTPEEFEQMKQDFAARSHHGNASQEPPAIDIASAKANATPPAQPASESVRPAQVQRIWPWLVAIAAVSGVALLVWRLRR